MATKTEDDDVLTGAQIEHALLLKLQSLQCDGQGAVDIAKLLFGRLEEKAERRNEAERLDETR